MALRAPPVNFIGTAGTFTWVNNMPSIGLPASGTGNISSFTAINTGNTPYCSNNNNDASSHCIGLYWFTCYVYNYCNASLTVNYKLR